MSDQHKFVLASGSPRRLALLGQIGIEPDRLLPADVDESPLRAEHPRSLARRLCRLKAEKIADELRNDTGCRGWPAHSAKSGNPRRCDCVSPITLRPFASRLYWAVSHHTQRQAASGSGRNPRAL
jgi:hypothetical protein